MEEEKELLGKIKNQFEETLSKKGFATKTDLDSAVNEKMKVFEGLDSAKLKSLFDENSGVLAVLIKQGEEITKLKSQGFGNGEDLSVKGQIASWMEKNKSSIEAIRNGEMKSLSQLHIKAAGTMTNATVNLGGSPYLPNSGALQGSVNDLNRSKPSFWNRLTKGGTKQNPYVWVNKINKQGNAAFIGEGVLKPLASFELGVESSVAKKVAERMKASTELLYDVEGMTSLIENEIRFEVETAANTAVLTGVGSATSPAGITTIASAFSLTTIKTTTPNNADAIRAAMAQLKILNFDRDIVAFINPIDAANMDLSKGTDGHLTSRDGQSLRGLTIVEDNAIAVGFLLIGDMTKYKILMYQDFFVNWGHENDDFSKNLMTIIGEMRFHQFFEANNAGAFIYSTFAAIKTAILAP